MREQSRAWVLLDVDGPLNPSFSSRQRSRLSYHHGWRNKKVWAGGQQYRLFVNPEHGTWLRALAADTGAELAWASTWEEHANRCVAPLIGLPSLPVAPARAGAKARSVVPWTGGRPFAWLDDDEDELAEASRLAAGQPHLCVLVDERIGLTQDHVGQVRSWLKSLQA